MYEEKKGFTRFTIESSYGHKVVNEYDSEDLNIEDCCQAFFSLLIGCTWLPTTILEGMRDFAESQLSVLPVEDNKEDSND